MDKTQEVSITFLVLLAVVPVFSGAVLTAFFTYLSSRRADRRDHTVWVREQQLTAVKAWLDDVLALMWDAGQNAEPNGTVRLRFATIQSAGVVQVVGGQKLASVIRPLQSTLTIKNGPGGREAFTTEQVADAYTATLSGLNDYFQFSELNRQQRRELKEALATAEHLVDEANKPGGRKLPDWPVEGL
jgi:hypothetical protein